MSSPKQTDTVTGAPSGTELPERAGIGDPMQNATLAVPLRPATLPPLDDREFDAWLRGHLAQLHAAVLTEPVPENLLSLLRGEDGARLPSGA